MSKMRSFWSTTVGKKHLVALTGLGIAAFTLMHMSGNLLLFAGPEKYNEYSHMLTSTPLLYVAEVGLLVLFLVHISLAISLAVRNRQAHPSASAKRARWPKRGTFASKSMVYTGLLLFVFTVLHLITFKYGTHYTTSYGSVEMRDLYRLVQEKFHEPGYVAWYLFSMLVLGIHLSHGICGAAQSLGLSSVRAFRARVLAYGFAFLVAFGFFTQPLVLFLKR